MFLGRSSCFSFFALAWVIVVEVNPIVPLLSLSFCGSDHIVLVLRRNPRWSLGALMYFHLVLGIFLFFHIVLALRSAQVDTCEETFFLGRLILFGMR